MKPGGLNPFLQAFIYNTYCLSKITYGLEIMSINKKTINTMNVMQNNLIRYLLQLSSFNHLSSIHQALKILNFKHLIFKYKLGFVSQLEGFTLSKKVFRHIITDEKKRHNSSSNVCDKNVSDFLQINLSDFGNKSVLNNQLDILNEKFNKKPEIVSIVKFCLENFCTKEFKDNLKVVTRFENEDYMIVDTVDTVDFFY
jgi:hypothetical protein